MSDFSVELDVLRDALSGRSLAQVGDAPLKAKLTSPVRIGNVSLSPSSELSINVFNHPVDRDAQAVFDRRADAPIHFDLQHAWIRYNLAVKVSGGATFQSAIGVKHATELAFSDYRRHDATESAWTALAGDLTSPRSILELDDVRSLRPGEALSMTLAGSLATELSFSWADVFASRLGAIVDGVSIADRVVVRLRKGLEVAASARIIDHFALVVSRTLDGDLRFLIRKLRARDHGTLIEVSLGGEVTAVPPIEAALEPLFEAITGFSLSVVESIARKVGVEELSTAEIAILRAISHRLRLVDEKQREKAVREAVEDLKRTLRKRLEEAARWKLSATLAHQYAAIAEDETIADFVLLDESKLREHHRLSLEGDLRGIGRLLLRESGGHNVLRFVDEEARTRRWRSGFSLSLGGLPEVSAEETQLVQRTTRRSLEGFELVTVRARRAYAEKNVAQNDFEWNVELRGHTAEYLENPRTSDLECLLRYTVTLERAVLTEMDLARMIDFAAMWDICLPADADLGEALGKEAQLRVQFELDQPALLAMLSHCGSLDERWAEPLAAAMPYTSMFEERASFGSRVAVYGAAWEAWLAGTRHPLASWAALLRGRIRSGLIVYEEHGLAGSFAWCSGIGHPTLRARLESFCDGLTHLRTALSSPLPIDAFEAAAFEMEQLWSQRLYVAASGRYILDRANEAGAAVKATLQIELDDETITA